MIEISNKSAGKLNRPRSPRGCVGILLLVFFLLSLAMPSNAREIKPGTYGFGFISNVSHVPYGMYGFITSRDSDWGIYVDMKMSFGPGGASNFYPNISQWKVDDWGDRHLEDFREWSMFDVGMIRMIKTRAVLFGAVGYAWGSHFRKYYDPTEILGTRGEYWITDGVLDQSVVNVCGGAIIFVSEHWSFLIGADGNPGGVTAGIGYGATVRRWE